jgi:hypothetical protein
MEKRKSPFLRWTEETERRRVLEFAALRACERVWQRREWSQASSRAFLTAGPAGASAFHC